jgi:DNA-binding GntR family transcriptional regulator
MEIIPLDIESAAIMEIAPDLSAFEIRRLSMTAEGVTFEDARDIYPGDRVIFLSNSASKEPISW